MPDTPYRAELDAARTAVDRLEMVTFSPDVAARVLHVIAAHRHDWDCAVGGHETDPRDCPECEHLRAAFAEEPLDAGEQ
jgi:hypothetical protein